MLKRHQGDRCLADDCRVLLSSLDGGAGISLSDIAPGTLNRDTADSEIDSGFTGFIRLSKRGEKRQGLINPLAVQGRED